MQGAHQVAQGCCLPFHILGPNSTQHHRPGWSTGLLCCGWPWGALLKTNCCTKFCPDGNRQHNGVSQDGTEVWRLASFALRHRHCRTLRCRASGFGQNDGVGLSLSLNIIRFQPPWGSLLLLVCKPLTTQADNGGKRMFLANARGTVRGFPRRRYSVRHRGGSWWVSRCVRAGRCWIIRAQSASSKGELVCSLQAHRSRVSRRD